MRWLRILGKLCLPHAVALALVERGLRRRQRRTDNLVLASLGSVHPTATFDTSLGGQIRIGHNVTVSEGAIIATYGGRIDIGDNVFIGPYAVLYGHGGLRIGNDVLIAAHTILIPANHVFSDANALIRSQGVTRRGIEIGRDCWLGARVTVLDGCVIGEGSVVGAGTVVNKSLPPQSVAVGVPARIVSTRSDFSAKELVPT